MWLRFQGLGFDTKDCKPVSFPLRVTVWRLGLTVMSFTCSESSAWKVTVFSFAFESLCLFSVLGFFLYFFPCRVSGLEDYDCADLLGNSKWLADCDSLLLSLVQGSGFDPDRIILFLIFQQSESVH